MNEAECKEIARSIIKEVMSEHINSCPHGKALLCSKWLVIGLFIGSGVLGGFGAISLLRVIL